MTITETTVENSLQMNIEGKIDTLTSQELLNSLMDALRRTDSLTIDMENVSYISSAGLRSFLLVQKTAGNKGGSFQLINVQQQVFEVFHSVGFDKIIKISTL